jgi:hypothetical protein
MRALQRKPLKGMGGGVRPLPQEAPANKPDSGKAGALGKEPPTVVRVSATRDEADDLPQLDIEKEPEVRHGFTKRQTPFVYIRGDPNTIPGDILREDKKKALRARKYNSEIVTQRLLSRILR